MLWGGQESTIQTNTGLGSTDPRVMVANVIRIILGFLGVLAVLLIMWGGWLWMSSNGNMEQVEQAKKTLIAASIGLVVVMASFGIAQFVLNSLYNATDATGGSPGGPGPVIPGPGPQPFSCDSNSLQIGCQADNIICDNKFGVGLYYCSTDCLCVRRGDVGEPCDADESTPECDPEDLLCMQDLRCDTDTCTCAGAPVIRWISPVGGFCDDDMSVSCRSDSDCPSGSCNQNNPNGAPGNFVTIGGDHFGDVPGTVYFWGGSDFTVVAPFPDSVNSNCTRNWTNDQIVVVVPSGAQPGPVRVVRPDSMGDATDDSRGPLVADFITPTIDRPGLCLVNPNQGFFEENFNVQGINFSGTSQELNFGDPSNFVPAINVAGWTNTSVNGSVPNIKDGDNTVFVDVDNEYSNNLRYLVLFDWSNLPIIDYISPEQGPPGQYVTIFGQNFGNYKAGTSVVNYTALNSYFADGNDFPAECKLTWWQDTYIVVKVPPAITSLGTYGVTVTNRDGFTSLPEDFPVTTGAPGPGICLLDPHNGPVSTNIYTYGDNMGDVQGSSFERFYNNVNAITYPAWADQAIQSLVPSGAQTGPVEVSDGSSVSNSLPFLVGFCTDDIQCNLGEECCQPGTYWAGYCQTQGSCSNSGMTLSGYGWSFSTGGGDVGDICYDAATDIGNCDPVDPPCATGLYCDPNTCRCRNQALESCSGLNLSQCAETEFCPNSPGTCSVYTGGGQVQAGACQLDCDGVGVCTSSTCSYDSNIDKCVTSNVCDIKRTAQDLFGNNVIAECEQYFGDNLGHWQFKTRTGCPAGWTMGVGNTCIDLNTTCSLCGANLKCYALPGGGNVCGADQDICPGQAVCSTGDICLADDSAACDCCCEIGFDARDCCAPLTCEGSCGSDTTDDGAGFGSCSGCDIPGATQAEKDLACNCAGSSGKYCDISVPGGVCSDCASLNTPQNCSDHSATCCVDGMKSDSCRGGAGDATLDPVDSLAYCSYYKCTAAGDACDSLNPVAFDTARLFEDVPSCTAGCVPGPIFGADCNPQYTAADVCDTSVCPAPFSCLDSSGNPPVPPATSGNPDSCGICCCDPNNDVCGTISPGLTCQRDEYPCGGPDRGLCCGCSQDIDCGDPSVSGCGEDTCCRARPTVISNYPADNAVSVCRNTLVSAEFDQEMDAASFTGNIVVAGDYGSGACPEGTTYLALADREPEPSNTVMRFLSRMAKKIVRLAEPILPHKFVQAYTSPGTNNYCATTGSIDSFLNTAGHTVMNFSVSQPLDADRLYYVILKGDVNLTSEYGIADIWKIGMNGPHTDSFNGLQYANSYIWSFTTGNDICRLSKITMNPLSYLFTQLDITQDFTAEPRARDGQIIIAIAGYDWQWNWYTQNTAVATVTNSDNPIQTVTPGKKKDGRTQVVADATITQDNVLNPSTVGEKVTGMAPIWVFICDNPWPPYAIDGSWAPWTDNSSNCNAGSGACYNTNFMIYYCRDQGNVGTIDDLPALDTSGLVIGQSSDNLKEVYFPSTVGPGGTSALTVAPIVGGGGADISWVGVSGVDGYNLYWGTKTGTYGFYRDVGNVTTYTLLDLTNNQKYYINITSYDSNHAESDYYGEIEFTPMDEEAPSMPQNLLATAGENSVQLSWDTVAGAYNYHIYYTGEASLAAADNYGGEKGKTFGINAEVRGLRDGSMFYFAVTAGDEYGNESSFAKIQATPFAGPSDLEAFPSGSDSTIVDLDWNLDGDGVNQTVYWGLAEDNLDQGAVIGGTDSAYSATGLASDTEYFFQIKTSNSIDEQSTSIVSAQTNK